MKAIEFPTLLAGPIVRRVEPTKIVIWVALSKRFRTRAKLFRITPCSNNSYSYKKIKSRNKTKTVQLGDHLNISLIEIAPCNSSFPIQTLIGYNLIFQRSNEQYDLHSLHLTSPENPHSLVYGKLKYPSFYIDNGETTKIIYGSCRKLHGKSGEDSLAIADLMLSESYSNLLHRPSSLFLMGDQIYADDVPDPALPLITFFGQKMMGNKDEPLSKVDHHLEKEPFKSAFDQIQGRQFISKHFCKFTSTNSHNHLIRLSEYAALYLLSWSPELWNIAQENNLLDSFDQVIEKNKLHFAFPDHEPFLKDREKEFEQHKLRYNEQMGDMRKFISAIGKVRRVLANVPTYMIFDDHDITDDWNLSADWKKKVHSAPLGRHVIANGLGAYWAFQAWGNAPKTFTNRFIRTVSAYLKSFNVKSTSYRRWLKLLLRFNSWHFIAPTNPKAVFIDTRTQRSFDPYPQPERLGKIIEENKRTPLLISGKGWKRVTESLNASGWNSGEPIIVVSATPVYGVDLIESLLHKYIYPFRAMGVPVHTALDFEGWRYNGKGFSELLHTISKWDPRYCIILSGDVHFANSVKSTIELHDGHKLAFYQFTSSPFNNQSYDGVWGSLMKAAIKLNSLDNKNKIITRYCSGDNYNIIEDNHGNIDLPLLWKEEVTCLPMDNGAIIETDNNIGMLSFSPSSLQNTLYKNAGTGYQPILYEKFNTEDR
ncbi:hypothetical protein [Bacillus sp. Marseille-P3661]|uniref:hypothetical protein n=1 Tax=Bacillus sp. Marseille-P3661 TaxID=1936234 RepID=UPI0015E19115|nr:hypothetical protein [Bacillus sp. Marseille-P3661]